MKMNFNAKPAVERRPSQRGIALVLTLILLSVTLVMALAFMAISQRERGSIATSTDTATARLAAQAALSSAEAQIVANLLAGSTNAQGQIIPNPYGFGLLVSTNYINPDGFAPGFNNINYDHDAAGNPLTPTEFLENLTNLFYSPRAPVFIQQNGTNDFRYYLDLNRNGRYDTNGVVSDFVTNSSGQLVANAASGFEVGDPEWIGVLEHPDQPYGTDNPFIARFAFLALPVGNSLDLNAIHNQTLQENNLPMISANDGYFRNQGVGSWEINLAAFLADLNTNQWGANIGSPGYYQYNRDNSLFANSGVAFNDAFSLLTNRYAGNYNTLAAVQNLFGANGVTAFENDNIDGYSDGPLQTGLASPLDTSIPLNDNPALPWAGADNTNHFFNLPSELFDATRSSPGFVGRLANASAGGATYDRYTFYRLLSQLGTDSTPESGKMNLDYDNLDVAGNVVPNAETNFIPWVPLRFFTNAADRMLRAYSTEWFRADPSNYLVNYYTVHQANYLDMNGVGVTNVQYPGQTNQIPAFDTTDIPVLVSNRFVYSPAMQRILQLAANIYDAMNTNFYPSIFRPIFLNTNGNVFIAGYVQQTAPIIGGNNEMVVGVNPDINPPVEITTLPPGFSTNNVYGVPWIIGAKKGFPNFNEFSTESAFQMTRKLQVIRDLTAPTQPDITWTNQMYLMNITNYYGVECWNSYRSNYYGAGTVNPGLVDILLRCSSNITLTNDNNLLPYNYSTNFWMIMETNLWHGWNSSGQQQMGVPSAFMIPLNTSVLALTNAMYFYNEPNPPNYGEFLYAGDSPSNYLDKGIRELPHFGMLTTNRLQVVIVDYSGGINNGRIIDYVQLGGLNGSRSLNSEIQANDLYHFWDTNYDANGNLLGVLNQLQVSRYGVNIYNQGPSGLDGWTIGQIPGGPSSDATPPAQQAFFNGFFASDSSYTYNGTTYSNQQTSMQAPYTPSVSSVQYLTWQANDPLVHYLASDLTSLASGSGLKQTIGWPENLGAVNDRYQPWEKGPPSIETSYIEPNAANLSYKDPLVRASDNWDFPAGKLPTVGWIGRIHRGTPWQTVYLKSTNLLDFANSSYNGITTWLHWTGNGNLFDATNTAPVEDRVLFDLFTTAFNANAARGALSVNVGSSQGPHDLSAWSALFSGITVLSNNVSDQTVNLTKPWPPFYVATNIQPVGPYNPALPLSQQPALLQIVDGIDQTRAAFTNADGVAGVFEHTGDILAVPQLSDQSPFLNRSSGTQVTNGINDEMYEWIPQQVMPLLSVGSAPRYVIYSYGQALKPAPNSIVTSGGSSFLGMATNYQIVSETATRAVVRIEGAPTNTHSVVESFNILPPN